MVCEAWSPAPILVAVDTDAARNPLRNHILTVRHNKPQERELN